MFILIYIFSFSKNLIKNFIKLLISISFYFKKQNIDKKKLTRCLLPINLTMSIV